MKKILIFILWSIISYANTTLYKDEDPSRVTNLSELKKFDKLAYELVEEEHTNILDSKKIFNFILKHKAYIHEYSLLKVMARGRMGRRTSRSTDATQDESSDGTNSLGFPEDFNYYRVGVDISYPLYDEKTYKRIHNNVIEYKAKLIDIIKEYQREAAEHSNLEDRREYYRLLQLRDKARQKTGQIYLDERLKTMERILDTNEKLRASNIAIQGMQMILLNYVKESYQSELEKML